MSLEVLSRRDLALVDAVAVRVLELLDERQAAAASDGERRQVDATAGASRLVDATELAEALSVSRRYVYEHSDQLGAVKLGSGKQPRLRFDVEAARAAMDRSQSGRSDGESACSEPQPQHIRGRSRGRLPSRLPPAGSVLPIRAKS